jgi:hypothetical protein
MAPEELVFWMGPIDGEVDARYGVLCRRHADSITVPRGWTLDDSRDPTLRLFRPTLEAVQMPRRPPADRSAPTKAAPRPGSTGEQLEFDDTRDIPRPASTGPSRECDDSATDDPGAAVAESGDTASSVADDVTATPGDDTGVAGLVRPPASPLLARAFRGTPLER